MTSRRDTDVLNAVNVRTIVGSSPMTEPERQRIYHSIRDAGGRLTGPTRTLVAILSETDQHLTADDLFAEFDKRTPGVARSTIYRVLQRLNDLHIVEHVHSGAGSTFYHLRHHGHAHLVCNDCGKIIDLADDVFDQLSTTVHMAYRFVVEPHHAALLGLCSDCSVRSDAPRLE